MEILDGGTLQVEDNLYWGYRPILAHRNGPNGFMEPKYDLLFGGDVLDTPIIHWEGEPGSLGYIYIYFFFFQTDQKNMQAPQEKVAFVWFVRCYPPWN